MRRQHPYQQFVPVDVGAVAQSFVLPAVAAYRTTNYGTLENNDTIPWEAVHYDDGGAWNIAQPSRLTVPVQWNGRYGVLFGAALWNAVAGIGYCELKVFKNGDTANPVVVEQQLDTGVGIEVGLLIVSRPLLLATGDYFELVGRTPGAHTIIAAGDSPFYFGMEVH